MADADPSQGTNQNIPLGILGHRAESERLGALTAFLIAFAPKMGEARHHGRLVEDDADGSILKARTLAIAACFDAVARVAVMSFFEPANQPEYMP